MVEYEHKDNLGGILKAVTDDNRRALLELLARQGVCRVTDIAKHFEMSLNAVSKHIKVLEQAGLVTRTTEGRTHWIKANLEPVKAIEDWIGSLKSVWATRLDALEQLLREPAENPKSTRENTK